MKALVTGAARGLGLGLCSVLSKRGYEVFGACRKSTPELDATGARIVPDVDVSTNDAIASLRKGVGSEHLDLLICNAGLNGSFKAIGIQDVDLEMMAYEYQVNTLGA